MGKGLAAVFTAVFMSSFTKIIGFLGLGFATYKGVDYMQNQFAKWIASELGQSPADALSVFYMVGGGVALNWIFGAYAFQASIKMVSKLTARRKAT